MKHALLGLIRAPQHQLKICKNGREVYGSEIRQDLSEILSAWFPQHASCSEHLLSEFLNLVIETLLYSPKDAAPATLQNQDSVNHMSHKIEEIQPGSTTDPASDLRAGEAEVTRRVSETGEGHCQTQICGNSPFFTSVRESSRLPKGCVLECMSRLQQMDQQNIEDIYLLHTALAARMEEDPQLRRKWRWDGPYTNVSWILGEKSGVNEYITNPVRDLVEEDVLKVKRFLVSKTLQDCSIIAAIKPALDRQTSQDQDSYVNFHGELYQFSIGIIDLDPKSFDKVPFYYHQAVDIDAAFRDLIP
ncbi:inositol-pentakisphosphate 2-kinase [Elysia marginata]|uniref:Inositol-pentakisphosphate 2-kinase n=1 Tax=Elysia marginata TaxID=1093978 RepID=A0AAV4F9J2_9GAST|nr:inositol-pentakisphosphate 2-kinase [Elysia marginata]